jgi:tetratricopeptide (TPR) repeat protein
MIQRQSTRSRRLRIAELAVLLAALTLTGCSLDGVISRHLSSNQKADAKKRWDTMRGGARVQLAQRHLESGRLEDAEKELNLALEVSPDNALAHTLAARLWLEQGQLARARESVAMAMTFSNDPEICYLAGIIAERYDDLNQALKYYEKASSAAPLVAEYVLARAELLITLGRPLQALELIESRLSDFERNAPLRSLAARIDRSLGLRAPALERAREAARLSDQDSAVVAELGDLLIWAGEYNDAIELLAPVASELRQGQPGKPQPEAAAHLRSVTHNLARAYLNTARYAEAVQAIRSLNDQANDPAAAVLLAQAALGQGDLDTAASILTDGGASIPAEGLLLLAYVETRRRHFDAAEKAAKTAIEKDDRLALAWCLLGQSVQAVGRMDDARRAYSEALAIDPDCRLAHGLLSGLSRTQRTSAELPNARRPARSVRRAVAHEPTAEVIP